MTRNTGEVGGFSLVLAMVGLAFGLVAVAFWLEGSNGKAFVGLVLGATMIGAAQQMIPSQKPEENHD